MGVMQRHVSNANTEGNNYDDLEEFSKILDIVFLNLIIKFEKKAFFEFSSVFQSLPRPTWSSFRFTPRQEAEADPADDK